MAGSGDGCSAPPILAPGGRGRSRPAPVEAGFPGGGNSRRLGAPAGGGGIRRQRGGRADQLPAGDGGECRKAGRTRVPAPGGECEAPGARHGPDPVVAGGEPAEPGKRRADQSGGRARLRAQRRRRVAGDREFHQHVCPGRRFFCLFGGGEGGQTGGRRGGARRRSERLQLRAGWSCSGAAPAERIPEAEKRGRYAAARRAGGPAGDLPADDRQRQGVAGRSRFPPAAEAQPPAAAPCGGLDRGGAGYHLLGPEWRRPGAGRERGSGFITDRPQALVRARRGAAGSRTGALQRDPAHPGPALLEMEPQAGFPRCDGVRRDPVYDALAPAAERACGGVRRGAAHPCPGAGGEPCALRDGNGPAGTAGQPAGRPPAGTGRPGGAGEG